MVDAYLGKLVSFKKKESLPQEKMLNLLKMVKFIETKKEICGCQGMKVGENYGGINFIHIR